MKELYISIDVEADGPIPGQNSMVSLGACAFLREEGDIPVDSFEVNLLPLHGAVEDPDTAKFWDENPEAWNATLDDQQEPGEAMLEFTLWVGRLEEKYNAKAVLVGYPGGYDFMFLQWYLVYHGFKSTIFDFSIIDIKSYAMAVLKQPYLECTKKHMPKDWKTKNKSHTHLAVDDAEEQGKIFMRMMAQNDPPSFDFQQSCTGYIDWYDRRSNHSLISWGFPYCSTWCYTQLS